MSAVYRIDVEHRPEEAPTFPAWYAKVVRISDGDVLATRGGDTDSEAVSRAQEALASIVTAQRGYSLYLDDEGRIVSDSVRV